MRRLEVTGGGDSSLHRSEVRGDVWSGLVCLILIIMMIIILEIFR